MNNSRSHRPRLLILLMTLVMVVALGSVATYLHISARAKFAEMKGITAQIKPPVGAVLLKESGEGDGLAAYACIDTHCPAYHRAYAIAIQPGSEMEIIRRLLETAGYRITTTSGETACVRQGGWRPICYAESVSDDLLVTVGIEFPTAEWHDWVPSHTSPPSTEWRRLTIGAADY